MIRGMKVRDRENGKVGFVSHNSTYGSDYQHCMVLFLDGSSYDYIYCRDRLELYDTGLNELEASLKGQKKDQVSRQQHADKYL